MTQQKWDKEKVNHLYALPLMKLMNMALHEHEKHFPFDEMELCTLLSIKTGTCPEDCAYCPQSAHYQTGVAREKLLDLGTVIAHAKRAKENGAIRFCMGAAWRSPPKKALPNVLNMIKAIKEMGLETCASLGMLDEDQAQQLQAAGLDFYNHNLDTSPDYYKKIITTRTFEERLETLNHVKKAGINICCGGILGMGESREDRIALLLQLASLPVSLKSLPINRLIPIKGTPLENNSPIDNFEFVRTIAIARIMMPEAKIRLSAGRDSMSDELQTLCFMAGANSIFYGEKLLTAKNPDKNHDLTLLFKLGMKPKIMNSTIDA